MLQEEKLSNPLEVANGLQEMQDYVIYFKHYLQDGDGIRENEIFSGHIFIKAQDEDSAYQEAVAYLEGDCGYDIIEMQNHLAFECEICHELTDEAFLDNGVCSACGGNTESQTENNYDINEEYPF